MASPAWIPQEVQTSTSQASVSGPQSTPAQSTESPTSKGTSVTATSTSDLGQEHAEAKFSSNAGYGVRPHPFSYNVQPNFNSPSINSQQSSSSPVMKSNTPGSATFLQPPVPSFSYNVGFTGGQLLQSRMPIPPAHSQGGMMGISPAASLQPPVPGQSALPGSFVMMQQPPNAANFSLNGNSQSFHNDQSNPNATAKLAQETSSNAPPIPPSVAQPSHTTPSTVSSTPNMALPTFWNPNNPSFQLPGPPRTPGISTTIQSTSINSSSPAAHRPIMQVPHIPSNLALQHQAYPPYQAPPTLGPHHPQGLWLPHPQQLPRPPLLAYPPPFPAPFTLPTHSMPLPSVAMPESQPPGVTAIGLTSTPAATAGSGLQPELPPGIDNNKHGSDGSINNGSVVSEQLDAWTAHRTETGAIYYYNALTGKSTYEKPPDFKGQPDKVISQPTPVSWEKLTGTDWALVTTDDGKKYYYNTKTKLSSWQIPSEVTELRKKQEVKGLKEETMSVPNSNNLIEKGSFDAPITLSAPAVNTGGRDATALRSHSIIPVGSSSSALDLIKRKLQDPGAPATLSPVSASSGAVPLELNGSKSVVDKGGQQSDNNNNNSKDKLKDAKGDGNLSDSSSDSEDVDSGPTKEECIAQFKEMLKERGIAPFSKWEKELPKIVFDPRFKAVPGYSARRALFEHYVRTRAEEERKERRAAQKAATEGFKQLLEEAKEDINHTTDYQTFKRKWGSDPRFEALERKEREALLNERVLPLRKAAQEKAQAERAAAVSSFKAMLREKGDITTSSRWSKMKDSLRSDPRYTSVKHEDREILFNEYISELKSVEEEAERVARAKRDEDEKLKERERASRKRKEREEQEVERVRSKARRKEAVESYQALLVETIKDPQVSWTESKAKLEKDPQGRANNPYLDQSDLEKFFREHVKLLLERCVHEFRNLLAEIITIEAATKETEDGKTVFNSWTTAKRLLKNDPRYAKMPRKERESLWRRHVDDMQRRQQKLASMDQEADRSYKRTR